MGGIDQIQPLALIPVAMRRLMEPRMRDIRVRKGRAIVTIGARQDEVFFVVEGEARVLIYSANGREVSVRTIGPGDIFGELAVLDGMPRAASVVALTDVRVRIMKGEDFRGCLEASPAAAIWLARRLGAEVRRLTEQVFELSALNVQSRLHCELMRLAKAGASIRLSIDPAPTHAELANRIGTHREAVTRELRALSQMNIIRNHRRTIEFLDLAALEEIVVRAVGAAR